MDIAFLKILNMSLTAGWLILAVMLIRLLFKRMPKSMRCLLWALVAVRLLCPFSIESVLSLVPSTETIAPKILYDRRPEIDSGIEVVDEVINPVFSESFAAGPATSVNPLQVWTFIAAYVWILGILILAFYAVFSYWRIRRKVRVSLQTDRGIWLCDDIDTPFILGVIYPRIYVPSSMEQGNLTYVAAHEKAHLKRKDHLWKPFGFLLLMIYWFNPLIWIAYILFCRDIELACDERVIKEMSLTEKKAYSKALLESSVSRHLIAACPLAFGEVGVKKRIRSVLNYKKPAFWVILAALLACILVIVCFMTDPEEEIQLFGSRYSVTEMLYDAPQYSFTYSLETAPEYTLTADHILMERGGIGSGDAWTDVGGLKEMSYSRQELYDFFEPLNNQAHEVLDQVKACWRADSHGTSERFYLVMQTKKEEVLLAVGHGREHVRWLWKLQQKSGSYDYEDLKQKIDDMGGRNAQIFALYEVDNIPAYLLIGYEAKGNLGLATFVYDAVEGEYVIKARRDFGGASLYSMTIQQEAGLNQSITVALSQRSDLAEVTAGYGEETMSQGVGTSPALTVFEWGEILPEDAVVDVRFYDAGSEELDRVDGPAMEDEKEKLTSEAELPGNQQYLKNIDWESFQTKIEPDEALAVEKYYPVLIGDEFTWIYRSGDGEEPDTYTHAMKVTTIQGMINSQLQENGISSQDAVVDAILFADVFESGSKDMCLLLAHLGWEWLILHEEDGMIYGIDMPVRWFEGVQENGLYYGAGGADTSHYYRMTFENEDYRENHICDLINGKFFVDGEQKSDAEYQKWRQENVQDAVKWYVPDGEFY